MKNVSIRAKILVGVVLINLVGALVTVVYLHQSYSGGLEVAAQTNVTRYAKGWEALVELGGDELGSVTASGGAGYAEYMKELTGADVGVLVSKDALDEEEYAAARDAAGLPNNWDERENYVLVAVTDEAAGERMQLTTDPGSVPEMGKVVGIENGACAQTCHGGMTVEGDFWKVAWSDDHISRAHTVFPASDEDGEPVATIYTIQDISTAANAARESIVRTFIVIGTGLLLATVLIWFLMETLVFRRLNKMIESIEDISVRVAGGDFDAHFVADGSMDEIGQFEQFFARFMDLISATLKSLINR